MISIDNGFLNTALQDKYAASLIGTTTKTIHRYKEPSKRSAALWELLQIKALQQVLPPQWKAKIIDGRIITETGYKINGEQLNQYGWHLTTIGQMAEEIRSLRQRLNNLKKETPPLKSNVIEFPKIKNGDIPA